MSPFEPSIGHPNEINGGPSLNFRISNAFIAAEKTETGHRCSHSTTNSAPNALNCGEGSKSEVLKVQIENCTYNGLFVRRKILFDWTRTISQQHNHILHYTAEPASLYGSNSASESSITNASCASVRSFAFFALRSYFTSEIAISWVY